MHERLAELERLVTQMSAQHAAELKSELLPVPQLEPAPSPAPSRAVEADTPATEHSECVSMRVGGSGVHYVNDDHWAAIMENIAVLKSHFGQEDQLNLTTSPDMDPQDGSNSQHSSSFPQRALLLYGCRQSTSREQILASLPPKESLDRYISRYFNYVDLVSSC